MTLDTENLTLIVTIATLFSVLIGPIITGLITAWQAGKDREEARRKEAEANEDTRIQKKIEYLQDALTKMITLRSNVVLIKGETERIHESSQAQIIALMRSMPFNEIRECAKITYQTDSPREVNIAIDASIMILGDRIWEEMNK